MKLKSLLIVFLAVTVGCGSDGGGEEETASVEAGLPSWIPENSQGEPWLGSLVISTSTNGIDFQNNSLFVEHAGVPSLIQSGSGKLIATYQYFSYEDEGMFDVIAFSFSEDDGVSWSGPFPVVFDLVPPTEGESKLVDPALVELDDGSLRLYFTIHPDGMENAHPASALANSIDGVFQYEGPCIEYPGLNLLDPTVIFFDGVWHYFTPKPGAEGVVNLHGTSTDGRTFKWEAEIAIEMNMLGNPVLMDGGIRFFGTGPGGALSAFSHDGFNWTLDDGVRSAGFDPAAAQRADGSYMLITTQ